MQEMEEDFEPESEFVWDEYPIEAFPENIRNYMQEIVKKVQVSNELVGGNVLAAMSTAVQNLGDVNLGSHTVPLSVFSLSVAPILINAVIDSRSVDYFSTTIIILRGLLLIV